MRTFTYTLKVLVSACGWFASGISAAAYDFPISYTDLTPPGASGGLSFTSGNQQGGDINGQAVIWNGASHAPVNLHPAGVTYSWVAAGAGNQQAGATYSTALWGYHAAIWTGTVASYRDLNPSWSSDSMALATTGIRQAGYVTGPNYQVHAGVWSGTAASFVDLHPATGSSSIAHAIAGDQQGGMVSHNRFPHAALWFGTAASYRNLHPLGAFDHSEIFAMTTSQQVGYAGAHAGIWFGTAESFVDLHPAGAGFSEAHATIDTMQAGFATLDSYRHAILWFGAADNYIDLQLALDSQYRESEARSIWTDGSTVLVAGYARDWPGAAHAILWAIAIPEPATGSLLVLALGMIAAVRKGKRSGNSMSSSSAMDTPPMKGVASSVVLPAGFGLR